MRFGFGHGLSFHGALSGIAQWFTGAQLLAWFRPDSGYTDRVSPSYLGDLTEQGGAVALQASGGPDDRPYWSLAKASGGWLRTAQTTLLRGPLHVFAIVRGTGAPAANDTWFGTGATSGCAIKYASSTAVKIVGSSSTNFTTTPLGWHLIEVVFWASFSSVSIDGGAFGAAVASLGATNINGLGLGSIGGNNRADVDVAEFIVFEGRAPVATATAARAYLAARYPSLSIAATATYVDPPVTSAPPWSVPADGFLCIGQSNEDGLSSVPTEAFDAGVYMLTSAHTWAAATHPWASTTNARDTVSNDAAPNYSAISAFANRMRAYYKRPFVLIGCSRGGTNVTPETGIGTADQDWRASYPRGNVLPNSLLGSACARAEEFIRQGGTLRGIQLCQGEYEGQNASNAQQDLWPARWQAIINYIRTRLNLPDLPVIFTQLPATAPAGSETPWARLRNTVQPQLQTANQFMVTADDAAKEADGLHWQGASCDTTGAAWASAAISRPAIFGLPEPDVTAPVFSSGVIDSAGLTLTMTYGEALDASIPAIGDFALSGTSSTVASVNVSGSTCVLTMNTAIGAGQTVLLSYTPGTNKLRDVALNNCAALSNQATTNNSTADITAPVLTSAIVPSSGTTVALLYGEALDTGSVPAAGDFALHGVTATIASVGVAGSTVTLTLTGTILSSETVTIDYTPGTNKIRDIAGNLAAALSGRAVTNNSSQGDTTAPTLSSAAIDSAGTSLILTYNEPLDTGSVPAIGAFVLGGFALSAITAVGIAGSAVTLTLAPAVDLAETSLTVSYTAGANKIRDVATNNAANLSSQAVTNGSTHAYDPRDEGGAVLWIDLNDASNYTLTASFITSIKNKITNTAIAATTLGGPFEATGLNSKPCMHPTLSTHGLSSTEAAVVAVGVNAHAYTLAWYGAYDAADPPGGRGDYFSFGRNADGNGSRYWGHNATGGGRQCSISTNDTPTTVTNASGADNSLASGHVVIWNSAGTTESCQVNNGSADPNAGANNPGTSTPTKFTLNVRFGASSSEAHVGKTSEIWLFNTQLGSAARTRVYGYLNTKWS